ncbi:MAG TPA: GAF domain-containing protein [Anaerolineae bacterium]|nr:GAF domain-containing protein [Anaerolineae bacterium]
MKRLIQFLRNDPHALRELEIIALAAMVISILVYFTDVGDTFIRPAFVASPFRGMLWVLAVLLMAGAILFAARRWREAARAQEQFRNIFDHSIEGFFQTTPEGKYRSANPAMARMYGYDSPAELIAAVPDISQQYVDPAQRAVFVRTVEAQGEVRDFETRLRCKDGRAIWVLANARVVCDRNGKILYYEGNVQDITARKEAEQAYERLVQQSLQAITIIQDGRIVFANQAHSDLLGYTTEEYLAMSSEEMYEMLQPEDRELVAQRQRDRLAGKAVPSRQVMQVRRKDGTWRWIESSITPIDYRGKPALLTSMTDITERKRAQDRMQETVERTQMREEVSAALARAGNDLNVVLQTLARVVGGALGDTCVVWLVSTDGKWVEPVAFSHARLERQTALRNALSGTRLAIDHPYLGKVITQGEPLFLPEINPAILSQNIQDEYRDYLSEFGVTSVLFVPIRHGGQVIGLLGVTREDQMPPYTVEDQVLLQEFADRAALAITNAQLVGQLQSELVARREAEVKYRTLVEQIPAITYIASADKIGETLYVSPQIEQLGFTVEEWVGTPDFWESRIHPDDLAAVLATAAHARTSDGPFHAEYRLLARDGSAHWIREDAVIVRDENNRRLFMQGTMLDLTSTERVRDKETRDQIEAAEREQRSFAQALGDAAALLNRATDYERVLDDILDAVARIVPYETASIFMRDGEVLRFARARGFEKYGLQDWIRTLSFPIIGTVKFWKLAEKGIPVIVQDTQTDEEWVPLPEVTWIRSHISVPIRMGGKTVGMLGLDGLTPGEFRAEHGVRLMAFAELAAAALHNAQFLREAQQRALEFEVLYETAKDLGRQSELPALLDLIVLRAIELLHSPFGAVFLRDAARGELVLETQHGGFVPAGLRVRTEEGLVGLVARTREPQIVYDYPHWERALHQPEDYPEVYSLMGAPLLYAGELIGVLLVGEVDAARRYSDKELRLLTLFAGQVASVVHNSRLIQETRQRAEQLALLYDVGLTLNRVLDERTQLDFLFKIARRVLHADRMAFLRYQPATDTLEYELGVGLPTTLETYLRAMPVSVRLAEGILGWVAHHRLPVRLGDVDSDPRWKPVEPGEHSAMAVPVEHDKALRGVLIATSEKYDEFTPQDERMLILFSNQIAAAMELSRMFEAQEQRQDEMEILREASVAFAATLDRDALLPAIVDYALRLVRGDNASLYVYENDCITFGAALWSPSSARPRMHFEPRPDGLTYRVARTGERIIIADAETDALYQENPWRGAIVGQPLRSGGRVLAVLSVAFAAPHDFAARELHALDMLADEAAIAMENVRHLHAQQKRSQELEILREAGIKFTATLNRDELITLILEYALQLVAADDAGFYLYDNETLIFGGILWGKHSPMKPQHWAPRPNGFTYTVARTGEPMVIDEVNDHPMFADWQWGGAIVGLPLKSGGRVRAVLNVAYEHPHRFEPEELRALQLLTDQAAVALENARHARETERQLRDAQLLHRAGEALNHTHSFQEAANLLADFFQEAVAIDSCCISILDEEHQELCVVVDHDPLPDTRVMPGTVFPLSPYSEYLRSLKERRALVFRRDMPDLPPDVAEDMEIFQWQALLVLPLFAGEQLLGIAELGDHNEPRDFSPDQVRLAESLAYQGAAALQNARLFEEAQRRAEQLTLLNRIARRVSGARTLDELLDVIEQETLTLLPCDSFYMALYDTTTEEVDFQRFIDNGKRLAPFRWHLAPSLTRHVITSARALRLDEQCDQAPADNPPQFYGSGPAMRSWLGVPMRLGPKVLGVISLQTARPRAFGQAEEQLLQTIADQVAVAVERVRGAE